MPRYITVTSLLNKTKKRDPWFPDDYTINPYSGCAFNCLYCYIRGSKYGINMADKLSVKENALAILRRQLIWPNIDTAADSKQLLLQAIQQYYPQHLANYQRLFAHNTSVPAAYNNALQAAAAVEVTRYDPF